MTNNWKFFLLLDLFDIRGTRTTPLLELEEYGVGKYPYVTTQATNNGIKGFYDFYTEEGNVLTVDSAVIGYCAYQPLNFSASDHVEKLVPKFKMNEYIAMFLVTILNMEQYRYNYGRKRSQARIRTSSIKLPEKNGKPYWDFMEVFIKKVFTKLPPLPSKKSFHHQKNHLNDRQWSYFSLIDLFDIKKGERLTKYDRIADEYGNIPLITASSENNGIVDYISFLEFKDSKKIFENKITIDMFFNVFYQATQYFSDDNVHTLIPKFETNSFINLFLVTLLKKHQLKYSYGRQARIHRIKKEKVKLPVTEVGKPDWDFMESYTKSLPYSKTLSQK